MNSKTKLIELADGIFIEVETSENDVQQVSSKIADKVNETLDKIKPILLKTCNPIISVWQELNREAHIEQAEVEIGLSFEGEGNIYITKTKAGANLTIKLIFKPKSTT